MFLNILTFSNGYVKMYTVVIGVLTYVVTKEYLFYIEIFCFTRVKCHSMIVTFSYILNNCRQLYISSLFETQIFLEVSAQLKWKVYFPGISHGVTIKIRQHPFTIPLTPSILSILFIMRDNKTHFDNYGFRFVNLTFIVSSK